MMPHHTDGQLTSRHEEDMPSTQQCVDKHLVLQNQCFWVQGRGGSDWFSALSSISFCSWNISLITTHLRNLTQLTFDCLFNKHLIGNTINCVVSLGENKFSCLFSTILWYFARYQYPRIRSFDNAYIRSVHAKINWMKREPTFVFWFVQHSSRHPLNCYSFVP